MAEENEQGKSEQPTPFKLREARRKGMVLKSTDVLSFLVIGGAGIGALIYLRGFLDKLLWMFHDWFMVVGRNDQEILPRTTALVSTAFFGALPILGVIALAALLGNLVQSGFVFSMHTIKPDWKKLNPAEGFKRLFSLKLLIELGKTLIKVVLFSLACGALMVTLIKEISLKGALSLSAIREIYAWYGPRLWATIMMLLAIYGIIDYWISYRQYNSKMRMSRREIREELKRQEGDPLIRQRLRTIRHELTAKSRSLSAVPDSDLILINPTHIALAIQYRPEILDAPVVVAKGMGSQAERIRDIAGRHGIPLFQNRALARRIYFQTKIGAAIEPEHYSEIARIMIRAGMLGKKNSKKRYRGRRE
ncbi:EscU/YscU/HrcU family type III secretion system export apparatus switch protein [Chitiniphilus shinanonensis]|uniref:EscU/YscU/HrcU family type III secretion system export apparatus switch protein n=1 Tax=Chitiniphilus shinanonensis TaxID=553088 RepID=UPI000A04C2F2|nr:EscU/YscU/HrcU family type III secretion system export apparatus switch protein [Chitiniphilus shinanonensis]